MNTYDGNELRDALRAALVTRWNSAAHAAELSVRTAMYNAIGMEDWPVGQITMPRADEPWVASLIEQHTLVLEAKAQAQAIDAQVQSVLP